MEAFLAYGYYSHDGLLWELRRCGEVSRQEKECLVLQFAVGRKNQDNSEMLSARSNVLRENPE
jgi:hypothetical protein